MADTTSTASMGGLSRIALVIGASSEIAAALIERLSASSELDQVIAISRSSVQPTPANVDWQISDYSESSISAICQRLMARSEILCTQIYICNGVLHKDEIQPEKKLADFDPESYLAVHRINTIIPMLWLKQLRPILNSKSSCVVSVFSARIGSIEDNGRGGWYSYRASKAALNMLVKNTAIEVGRTAKKVKFIVFHPGTTDTPLSKPFQKFVSPDALFTPEFVATRLLDLVENSAEYKSLSYLDWDGKPIQW